MSKDITTKDEGVNLTRRDLTFTSLAFGAAAVLPSAAAMAQSVTPKGATPPSTYPKGFQEGMTMPAEYYLEEKWYARDEAYLASNYWWLIDHESRIPKPGDYFLFQFGRGDSVIIARDEKGVINAFHNVCQHRGSRLCVHDEDRPTEAGPGASMPDKEFSIKQLGQEGNTSVFRCPYHAWTFDLTGKLVSVPGPQMSNPAGFKMEEHGLNAAHIRTVDGFIFVSLATGAAPQFELPQGDFIHPKLKIAARRNHPTKANWKLVLENFVECYHCQPAHSNSYTTAVWSGDLTLTKAQFEKIAADAKKQGRDNGTYEEWLENRYRTPPTAFQADKTNSGSHSGTSYVGPGRGKNLRPGWQGHTVDGKIASAKLIDESGRNFYATPAGLRRGMNGIIYHGDYATIYRFVPRDVENTDVELVFLVHPDAVEGKDYDVEHLIAFWNNTVREDRYVAENNHVGLKSRGYRFNGSQQPYMKSETGPSGFVNWYLAEMIPQMLQAEAQSGTKVG